MNLFKDKILLYTELSDYLKILFENVVGEDADYLEAKSWETTPLIKAYLAGEIAKEKALGKKFVTEADYNNWSNHVKNELKIKGKQLFMGMRSVLTLQAHGPDLKFIIPLTSLDILETRLK
jgi:glutamyl/glutaminyl-tRNA synthetase